MFMSRMKMLVISHNMKGDSEKQCIYLTPENQCCYQSLMGDKELHISSNPIPPRKQQLFPSEQSPMAYQKYSADEAEENQNQFLNQSSINLLHQSMERQSLFMENLSQIRDGIIQHEIVSHISHQGEKYQRLNFAMVKKFTQNRIDKMIKNKKLKKNWSNQDVKILVWIVAKYCEKKRIRDVYTGIKEKDWQQISSLIPGTTSEMCMFKWLGLKKSKIRDQKWKKSEEQLLIKQVETYGEKNWALISKQLFYQNQDRNKVYRNSKQCRQHWNCFLNPNIKKGNWTLEEDILLAKLIYKAKGKKHWARMVGEFGGRTENALKNRYAIVTERERNCLSAHHPQKLSQMEVLEKFIEKKSMKRENSPKQQIRSSASILTKGKTIETIQPPVQMKDQKEEEGISNKKQGDENNLQKDDSFINENDDEDNNEDDGEINEVNISEVRIVDLDREEFEKLKGNISTKKLIMARQSKEGVLLLDRKSFSYINYKCQKDS